MYTVKLTHEAEKSFGHLMKSQPAMGRRIAEVIDQIAENPNVGIPLRGDLKGLFKYRVGPYRVLYTIEKKILVVTVIDIGHRKEVYR